MTATLCMEILRIQLPYFDITSNVVSLQMCSVERPMFSSSTGAFKAHGRAQLVTYDIACRYEDGASSCLEYDAA